MDRKGKVWLVGAGPSDCSLLTLKGKEVLENAEVVIYDQLVDLSILLMIPKDAEAIDVGKHAGNHTLTQEKINQLMAKKALEGKRVVRLKGGDPFVFGRGGEEIEALISHHITYEVVPGVASPIAVPAYAGIPVTHRDYTSSFHIITAHHRQGSDKSIDYKSLAALGDVTLIFLMGIGSLEEICQGLIDAGIDRKRLAAVIQNGARYNQRKIGATLETLPHLAKEANIGTPGIIIVGEVCRLEALFTWAELRPLSSKRVIVTRPKEKKSNLAQLLRAEGAEVLELPVTKILSIHDEQGMEKMKKNSVGYDWIIFTSVSGVTRFFEELKEQKMDLRQFPKAKYAVVGEATHEALVEHGIQADIISRRHTGTDLSKELVEKLSAGQSVLLVIPENQKSSCKESLMRASKTVGFECDSLALYKTELVRPRFFEWMPEDIVIFTSNSTVDGFVRLLAQQDYSKVNAVCIGQQTLARAKSYGIQAIAAEDTTMESLVEAIVGYVHNE